MLFNNGLEFTIDLTTSANQVIGLTPWQGATYADGAAGIALADK